MDVRPSLVVVLLALAGPSVRPGEAAEAQGAVGSPAEHRALLDRYCVTCHNTRLQTADLVLDTADLTDVGAAAEIWEKVVRKLRAGTMPPPPRPRPVAAVYEGFRAWLEAELDRAAAEPDPGRTETFHRLNRTEYHNAVRDLLDLEIDVASLLPVDAVDQHGFDNNAGALSVSPSLLERYVSAAGKVSRLALGLDTGLVIETYDVPLDLVQDHQVSEKLPFGSRGGIAIRHTFPVDGEYRIKVRLQTNYVGYIRGLESAHDVEVRLDGHRLARFTVGGDAPGAPAPLSYGGNISGDPEWENYMHVADEGLEVRVAVSAGPRVVGVAFPRELWEAEGVRQPRQSGFALAVNEMQDSNPALGSVEIAGPYEVSGPGETPSRRRILICRPGAGTDELACARRILSTLARRAFRRPVTDADVGVLLEFFAEGRRGATFDDGVQFALERLLTDPEFLFRIERDPSNVAPGSAYWLSDLELASRLSFFLWSSIPDDELLDLAERGVLRDPEVQARQVRRMLADPRARALVENFAAQWLYLRNVRTAYPDPDRFPQFDQNLRGAFLRETELFIESQLVEDRSVLELLMADYTYLNERLARHYGIPHVYGSRFRRVQLEDDHRRGLLGHGSVMTVTSYPNRTSPVVRGKWVLENLFGTPPPEPPPNVPALEEKSADGRALSMREAMVRHRQNPACSACHAPMDPLGFALENFDAVGEWRDDSEAGAPIDPSATLPDGTQFHGPAGLRALVSGRPDQFAGTVTEKLLTYALGRGLEYYDAPSVRAIVRAAAAADYRWSAIIQGVVRSAPFQMRRSGS